jgi:CheY-like chemotaxis protein
LTDRKNLAHFLLVEDDEAQAELVMLSMEDNCVTNTIDHVGDGVEAMAYLRREGSYAQATRPDIVLLDLNLPKMNGHEVLAQIKSDPSLCEIPVVILTTSASEADRAKAYAHNANSFVTKPVDFAKFQQMCRDLSLYWTVWNQPPAQDSSASHAA